MWGTFLSTSIVMDNFVGHRSLERHLCSLRVCRQPIQCLLNFRISIENSGMIVMTLPLHAAWSFSAAAFNFLSLFSMFIVLIIMYHRNLFFCCCLLCLLYIYCTPIGTSVRLLKFSSIFLWKIFLVSALFFVLFYLCLIFIFLLLFLLFIDLVFSCYIHFPEY